MKAKGDAHYLEKQPGWLKEIVPNTTVTREFGIHRSSDKIVNYLHGCLKTYTEEELSTEKDKEGNIIKQVIGMQRVMDPVLLEEMIQYNEEGNFDRLVAAELAIAQAIKMDPIYGKIGGSGDGRIKSLGKARKEKPHLFNSANTTFKRTKTRKLFK